MTAAAILSLAAGLLLAAPTVHSSFSTSTSATGAFRTAASWRPVNTVPPSITGTVALGAQLTGRDGEWSGAPASLTRSWLRCGSDCTPIPGATSSTYTLTTADIGHRLRFEVTAGSSPSGASDATAPLAPSATAPTLTGDTPVGSSLTVIPAVWTLHPTLAASFGRTWWRCPVEAAFSPQNCALISAASGATTYSTSADDVGREIIVEEHATQNGVRGASRTNRIGPVREPQRLPAAAETSFGSSRCDIGWIVDTQPGTTWCSNSAVQAGQRVTINFGAARTVTRVRFSYASAGASYVGEVSANGTTWTTVPTTASTALTPSVMARFVRLRALTPSSCGCPWAVTDISADGF